MDFPDLPLVILRSCCRDLGLYQLVDRRSGEEVDL